MWVYTSINTRARTQTHLYIYINVYLGNNLSLKHLSLNTSGKDDLIDFLIKFFHHLVVLSFRRSAGVQKVSIMFISLCAFDHFYSHFQGCFVSGVVIFLSYFDFYVVIYFCVGAFIPSLYALCAAKIRVSIFLFLKKLLTLHIHS